MKNHSRQSSLKQNKPLPLTSVPFPQSTSITTLNLSHNNISVMSNLSKLKYLITLDLSFNKISKIQNIFQLHQLQQIMLNNNLIQYLPQQMKDMRGLKKLDVSHNRILYIHGISSLEGKELMEFKVEGNRVTKRPKFNQTLNKILETKEYQEQFSINNQILQHQHLQKELTNENTIQNTIENIIFPKQREGQTLFSQIQMLGTYRSITQTSCRVENQQFQSLLQVKDRKLFNKKNQILGKYQSVKDYSGRIDDMIEQDRYLMESDSQMVQLIGKYMLDVQLMSRQILDKVKDKFEQVLVSFESCSILQKKTGLRLIVEQNQVEYHQLLIGCLNSNQSVKENNKNINKIKEYLSVFNCLKSDIIALDQLIIEYITQFNHLYKVIELKTILQDPLTQFPQQQPPSEIQQNIINALQQQIQIKNKIEEQLIKENNILLEKIDTLTDQNTQHKQEVQELRQRWILLQQIKQEGNILSQQIILKQQTIIGLMEQKLTGDFFQNIMLNQAQTIQQLINTNKTIRQKIYIQEMVEKGYYQHKYFPHRKYLKQNYTQNLETNVGTGKKQLIKQIKSQQCSAESNLLSDRPQRKYVELPVCPINYFSKSFNLVKSKASQPTTYRNSNQNNRYLTSTYRDSSNPQKQNYQLLENTVAKKFVYNRDNREESEGYKDYMRYCLRNNIVQTLIQKNTHEKVKQRYSQKQLRQRKFKQITSKRVLTKQ